MSTKINTKFIVIASMVFLAAMSRLLPHPPNFTAVGAMGLFGAAYFSKKHLAFLVPFLALWISNLVLDNLIYASMYPEYYEGFVFFRSFWIYFGFGLVVALGLVLLKKVNPINLIGASLGASVVFFLVTNFGSWLGNPMYPKTFTGLIASYTAGIPFFWNTLLGDLFFSGVLFGSFALIRKSSLLPATESMK